MGKTHYAHVDRANESDNTEYWSSTACGLEYTESLLTDKPKEVTCKNCLRAMARHEIDESVLLISGVVKSLPTDECIEQWWAEGQDQKEGFWHEAPYRTNGDVVEEIKTALKYFIETWQRHKKNSD